MRFLKYFFVTCLFATCNILPGGPEIVDYVILFEAGVTEETAVNKNKDIGPMLGRLIGAIDNEVDVIIASSKLVRLLYSLKGKSDKILDKYRINEKKLENQIESDKKKLEKKIATKKEEYIKDSIKVKEKHLKNLKKAPGQVQTTKQFLKKIKKTLRWTKKEAKDEWSVYRTEDKKFAILVSNKAAQRAKKTDGSVDLKKLGLSDALEKVEKWDIKIALEPEKEDKIALEPEKEDKIDMRTFEAIFDYDSDAKKIVYFSGHGRPNELISQLNREDYSKFLKCMDKAGCILLFVSSCCAGGLNLLKMHLKHMQSVTGEKFEYINFPIIIGSLSDAPVINLFTDLGCFFKEARSFFSKRGLKPAHWVKEPFKKMVTCIIGEDPDLYSLSLICFPELEVKGIPEFFRVIEVDKKVKVITYPYLIKHELKGVKPSRGGKIRLKKQPIKINNMKALLIYPSIVNVPLRIRGSKLPKVVSMIPGPASHYIKEIDAKTILFSRLIETLFSSDSVIKSKHKKVFFIAKLTCKNFRKSGILHPESPEKDNSKDILNIKNLLIYIDRGHVMCCFQLAKNNEFFECSLKGKKKKLKCKKIKKSDFGRFFEILRAIKPKKSALFEATGGVESIYKFRNMVNKHIDLFIKKEVKPSELEREEEKMWEKWEAEKAGGVL